MSTQNQVARGTETSRDRCPTPLVARDATDRRVPGVVWFGGGVAGPVPGVGRARGSSARVAGRGDDGGDVVGVRPAGGRGGVPVAGSSPRARGRAVCVVVRDVHGAPGVLPG